MEEVQQPMGADHEQQLVDSDKDLQLQLAWLCGIKHSFCEGWKQLSVVENKWLKDPPEALVMDASRLGPDVRAITRLLFAIYQQLDDLHKKLQENRKTRKHAVTVRYTNHRGETALRRIVPLHFRYGSTLWHPEAQWLLEVLDVDRTNYETQRRNPDPAVS